MGPNKFRPRGKSHEFYAQSYYNTYIQNIFGLFTILPYDPCLKSVGPTQKFFGPNK